MSSQRKSSRGALHGYVFARMIVSTFFFSSANSYFVYAGTLKDGTKFDSSVDRNEPFKFQLGQGMVIKGWDIGFASMKKGEKAVLTITSDYGYGDRGSPPKIPGGATLIFEVELLDFFPKKKEMWEMSPEEKIEEAKKCKDKGNAAYVVMSEISFIVSPENTQRTINTGTRQRISTKPRSSTRRD